jgi:hypothetical protein
MTGHCYLIRRTDREDVAVEPQVPSVVHPVAALKPVPLIARSCGQLARRLEPTPFA